MSEMSQGTGETGEQDAPGWAAIDDALGRLYPRQVPHQFASQRAYELDGESPLPAIAVYEAVRPEHWHYVTYGLSELFEKTSRDAAVSGFGFELTMRVPRVAGETEPPSWPLRALQGLSSKRGSQADALHGLNRLALVLLGISHAGYVHAGGHDIDEMPGL